MTENIQKSITFAEYAEEVMTLKKYEVRNLTFENHWRRTCENHLIPYFGNMLMEEIRYNHIAFYFIGKKDMCRETLKGHLSTLNEIFKNASANEIISKNPCENFVLKVGQESAKRHIYTKEQAELVLKFCPEHRYGLAIDIMLRYGVSRSELLGICWDDIDFCKKTICISKGVTVQEGDYDGDRIAVGATKNKFRTRLIAVEDETIALINKHPRTVIVGQNKHKHIDGYIVSPRFLIYNKYGKVSAPDTWYDRQYKVFMRDMHAYYLEQGINIPILTPHELRHTRASIWVNDGKNPFAIAAQMGWADFEMLSKVYGHRDIDRLRTLLDI